MSKSFCIYAWQSLMTTPEGGAKICCAANRVISDHNGPMRLADHSAAEIWNSPHMVNVRQSMAAGRAVRDCLNCYLAEADSGQSLRTEVNTAWSGGDAAAAQALMAESARNDHRVDSLPTSLHLTGSNLCNLACRMCNSSYSSRIEQHPELAELAPRIFDVAPEDSPQTVVRRTIGPGPALGVAATGFDDRGGMPAGQASLDLPTAWFEKPVMLHLDLLDTPSGASLSVVVNDQELLGQPIELFGRAIDVNLLALPDTARTEIRIAGSAGIRFRSIELSLLRASDSARAAGKVTHRPSANHQRATGELIANPDLGQVNITGGEPMLMPEVAEVMDYLVNAGRAPRIDFSFSTNATRINPHVLGQLKKFRRYMLFLSIDGVGEHFDYIRVPARWERVRRNAVKIVETLGTGHVALHPTIQAYNILNVVEICRFADALGLEIRLLDILVGPEQLAIQVMPPKAREIALGRLRQYRSSECRPENLAAVDNLIANLVTTMPDFRSHLLPRFASFTARLDRIHRQDFRRTHRELSEILEESGVNWSDVAA